MKNRIWTKLAVGMVAVLVLALSATLAFAQTDDGTVTPDVPGLEGEQLEGAPAEGDFGRTRRHGSRNKGAGNEYLAAELGITVEELEAAGSAAREAAMADREAGIELDREAGQTYLADALGITVEELEAANTAASAARVAQAIEDGVLTEEEAELSAAREALKEYIDREALQEEVMATLGVSAEDLAAAKEAGTNSGELLAELGLTREDVEAATTTAYEATVAQAVADGVITQEQADQLGENAQFGGGHHGRGGRGHGGSGGRRGGSAPDASTPDSVPTVPTGITFGA